MEIKRNNEIIADVYLLNDGYVVEEIMGEHTLTLNFRLRDPIEFEINDYVEFGGNIYSIRYKERVKKEMKSLGWEYTIKMYSSQYELQDVLFFLHGKPERRKNADTYNGTAFQMLGLIVENMNRESSGWQMGSCINTETATFSFKDKKCMSVLEDVVKTFETEYWIEGKTISIGKREYSSNGLYLGQGEGMGFRDLELAAVEEKPPVTVLYPYGSDKNLAANEYGSDYLVLPDGKLSLEKNINKYGRFEESKQFDHIYPKEEFTVVQKIDNLNFISNIDFNLTDYLIDDTDAIVTFQGGGLAGYDLAIWKNEKEGKVGWDNATKKVTLVENKQENALTVPGDINFEIGDKFILTGIKMPQKYISDAEQRLLVAAQNYLDENCEKKVKLNGKCDDIYFKKYNIYIACGQMVRVISEKLELDREIRVTRVKKFLENDREPYRYEITLSDFLDSNNFKDIIDDVNKFPDEIQNGVRPIKEWSKRSWRDVMETLKMMFDPDGDYFSELIKPLAVHTAQLIVGTNSQQFELIGLRFIPNANNNANTFEWTAGTLVHFTVNDNGTIAQWNIPASSTSLSNTYAYYVYARCSKTSSSGSIYVTTTQIKLEDVAGYYHFWIGVLNTPIDGVRSWNPNYGYTEIAGQTITTGVIKDKNARLIIDLINATIEGQVTFKNGTSGYNNISDKPDLDSLEYKIINKSNEKAELEAQEAKEALAKNMGYDSYEELVMEASRGETIIKDGIINTDLLAAETIVTKGLMAEHIQALEIATNRLEVLNDAKIGAFKIENNGLNNEDNKAYVKIRDAANDKYVQIGGSDTYALQIQSYGGQNVGLYVLANNAASSERYAITSYGPHIFGQRTGETWNAPGALFAGYINTVNVSSNATITKVWGDGVVVNSTARIIDSGKRGYWRITHNLNHENYVVIANPYFPTEGYSGNNIHDNYHIRIQNRTTTTFDIRGVNADNAKNEGGPVFFVIIGRNKFS